MSNRVIGPVYPSLITRADPWRIAVVLNANDTSRYWETYDLSDPAKAWTRFEYVRDKLSAAAVGESSTTAVEVRGRSRSEPVEVPFEIVGIDEAPQYSEEAARAIAERFSQICIQHAFLAIPPEGGDFDDLYRTRSHRVIDGSTV